MKETRAQETTRQKSLRLQAAALFLNGRSNEDEHANMVMQERIACSGTRRRGARGRNDANDGGGDHACAPRGG